MPTRSRNTFQQRLVAVAGLPERRPNARSGSTPRVECWGQADAALAELGRLQARIARVEERRAAALARAQAAAAAAGRDLETRRQALEQALERFCRSHKAGELERVNGHSRRSRKLFFGRLGYRRSQAVVVRSEAAALRALAHWRAGQRFLRPRTELDREALREFLLRQGRAGVPHGGVERRLRRAGIALEQRESWFYELDQRAIERWG